MQETTSRKDAAYVYLKGQLLSCTYLPGQTLRETEIAEETGLGRTPVREALLMLQSENLIEIIPRQGTRASIITEQSILELYQMRRILEPAAAIKCRARIDNVHLLDFQRRLHRFCDAETLDSRTFFAMDTEFHRYLIDCIGNQTLSTVFCRLMQDAYRIHMLGLLAGTPMVYSEIAQQHIQIIHALLIDNASEIDKAYTEHINASQLQALETLRRVALEMHR